MVPSRFFFFLFFIGSLYIYQHQCFQCFCSYHTLHKERNILHAVCQWFCSPPSSHWDSLNTVVGNLKSRRKFSCFWWDGFNPRWCPECTYEKKNLTAESPHLILQLFSLFKWMKTDYADELFIYFKIKIIIIN